MKAIHPHEFLTAKILTLADNRDYQNSMARTKKNRFQHHQHIRVLLCSFSPSPEVPTSFCIHSSEYIILRRKWLYIGPIPRMLLLLRSYMRVSSNWSCWIRCGGESNQNLSWIFIQKYSGFSPLPFAVVCNQWAAWQWNWPQICETKCATNFDVVVVLISKCQQMTPRVAIQRYTWCLSFGKYLEMWFHTDAYRRRRLETSMYSIVSILRPRPIICSVASTWTISRKMGPWPVSVTHRSKFCRCWSFDWKRHCAPTPGHIWTGSCTTNLPDCPTSPKFRCSIIWSGSWSLNNWWFAWHSVEKSRCRKILKGEMPALSINSTVDYVRVYHNSLHFCRCWMTYTYEWEPIYLWNLSIYRII